MNRKNFFINACTLGVCSCTGLTVFGSSTSNSEDDNNPEIKKYQNKLNFIHKRFASLMEIMDGELDDNTKNTIVEKLGCACAEGYYKKASEFSNNLKGFLEKIENSWAEKTSFNEENQIITIVGKKGGSCGCNLVKQPPFNSEFFCNCSKGWMKTTFETVSRKKVHVEILESKLKGGERCSFKIKMI